MARKPHRPIPEHLAPGYKQFRHRAAMRTAARRERGKWRRVSAELANLRERVAAERAAAQDGSAVNPPDPGPGDIR
jgi:molecular chaperone GrpE (heat shock protein)